MGSAGVVEIVGVGTADWSTGVGSDGTLLFASVSLRISSSLMEILRSLSTDEASSRHANSLTSSLLSRLLSELNHSIHFCECAEV